MRKWPAKMADLSDLPPSLARLVQKLLDAVADLTAQLERGEITVRAWQREMERLLTRYHEAAFMLGLESPELDDEAMAIIVKDIEFQLGYLDAFAATIAAAGAGGWLAAWGPRAGLYALSPKRTYWQGVASKLSIMLPGYPGESECLSNCGCSWDVREVKGGYDAYWRRGKSDSCNGCRQREAQWNPYRIREGGKR
jgi:hypothetical protein